jgi:hypothetical protein
MAEWSGANSITIYAPQFFELLGTTGQTEKLFATAIFGVVKFASALICAFFLVDFIGRKRALSLGIYLQGISVLYIAIYLTAVPTIKTSRHAGTGAIVFIYLSGVGWALGWNSIQYLIGAEMFPLRVRALGSSMTMCFHFVNQYGNSKVRSPALTNKILKSTKIITGRASDAPYQTSRSETPRCKCFVRGCDRNMLTFFSRPSGFLLL